MKTLTTALVTIVVLLPQLGVVAQVQQLYDSNGNPVDIYGNPIVEPLSNPIIPNIIISNPINPNPVNPNSFEINSKLYPSYPIPNSYQPNFNPNQGIPNPYTSYSNPFDPFNLAGGKQQCTTMAMMQCTNQAVEAYQNCVTQCINTETEHAARDHRENKMHKTHSLPPKTKLKMKSIGLCAHHDKRTTMTRKYESCLLQNNVYQSYGTTDHQNPPMILTTNNKPRVPFMVVPPLSDISNLMDMARLIPNNFVGCVQECAKKTVVSQPCDSQLNCALSDNSTPNVAPPSSSSSVCSNVYTEELKEICHCLKKHDNLTIPLIKCDSTASVSALQSIFFGQQHTA